MILDNLSLWKKTKLKIARNLFSIDKPEIRLLDKLEIELKEAKVSQVNIPPVYLPELTPDLCLTKAESVELEISPCYKQIVPCQNSQCLRELQIDINETLIGRQLKITCPVCHHVFVHSPKRSDLIEDLTEWLGKQMLRPEIESFPVLLGRPGRAGKSYQEIEEEKQATLLREDENCIHGLNKKWCAICAKKEKEGIEKSTSQADLFDMIFPILQPPLGEDFDSPIMFPPGMELYPFQREGVRFLAAHDRALLGDEMGLGKSIQTIVVTRFLFRIGKITNGLILCPKSVLTDWEKKLWDWAPELRIMKVNGSRERRKICWNSPAHVYLTTYETLRQDLLTSLEDVDDQLEFLQTARSAPAEDIAKTQFDLIVLDEVQKIKNPGAKITKAARMIDSPIRWGLSGTPLENRLEDLISIFSYLRPGTLHYSDVASPSRIKKAMEPYFLRRRKTDALPDLPEKVHEEVWLDLAPEQRAAYDRAEKEGIVALNEQGDSVTVQHILALITKLKQICNIEPVSRESCKLEYLLERLGDVAEQGDKALIFSQYPNKTLELLKPELKRFNPSIYHGSLSSSQRDSIIEGFQNEEDSLVLLMSVKAGALGLTLTRANYVYHYDLWWNPSVAAQAEDRAHRIGQKKTVFVTSLFTTGTIEERIQEILKRKLRLFQAVIDDLSDVNISNALTEEELFGLFDLNRAKPAKKKNKPENESVIGTLEQISPQQFEQLVANLYERIGYDVKLTPPTRDQGVDIYAKRISETGVEHLAIQCKHWPKRTVGVNEARTLYGVIQAKPDITRGALLTSGTFSRECGDFARGKRIELIGGERLSLLLQKYGTSV